MTTLNADRLAIYVDNSSDIYLITESLFNSLANKIRKGLVPSVEHLANCSSMKKLIGMAAKMVWENDHAKVTSQERKEVALNHAQYIIDCAEYIAADNN